MSSLILGILFTLGTIFKIDLCEGKSSFKLSFLKKETVGGDIEDVRYISRCQTI